MEYSDFSIMDSDLVSASISNVLLRYVEEALDAFNANESYLIEHDVSERCICAKFAAYLEKTLLSTQYKNYDVDVEYNRGRGGNDSATKTMGGKKIVTDLIVHKRGKNEEGEYDNLICVEMKKEYKHLDMENDKKRLEVLTDKNCGFYYKLGLMVVARRDRKRNIYGLYIDSIYVNGRKRLNHLYV